MVRLRPRAGRPKRLLSHVHVGSLERSRERWETVAPERGLDSTVNINRPRAEQRLSREFQNGPVRVSQRAVQKASDRLPLGNITVH